MNTSIKISMLVSICLMLNLAALSASAAADQSTQSYMQGYEDGFIYTAQQTGKGCKDRLSQAAVARLDQSVKSDLQIQGDIIAGDSDMGDIQTGGDRQIRSDYNQGKLHGMGDALTAPRESSDLCTNGD